MSSSTTEEEDDEVVVLVLEQLQQQEEGEQKQEDESTTVLLGTLIPRNVHENRLVSTGSQEFTIYFLRIPWYFLRKCSLFYTTAKYFLS